MKHIHVGHICDALVLALVVEIFASFCWVVGLVVGVVGFWLRFVFRPRGYARTKQEKEGIARCRQEHADDMDNPLHPLSPLRWDD